MVSNRTHLLAAVLGLAASSVAATSISATPHDSYSSSVGVLGCKVDTNRIAYWPRSVDCDSICVKVTHGARSVNLLRIDQSGGAHDISYDAWVYLQTGKSAIHASISGGGVAMQYENVDASECASLIHTDGHKLPLSASNSMNFLTECLAQPSSWVAKNHVLYNICDPICTLGIDETCSLNLAVSNQPRCRHTLGLQSKLTTAPVYDISFGTGKVLVAGSDDVVSPGHVDTSDDTSPGSGPATTTAAGGVFAESSTVVVSSTAVREPTTAAEEPTTAVTAPLSTSTSTSSSSAFSTTSTWPVVVPSTHSHTTSSTTQAPSSTTEAPSTTSSLAAVTSTHQRTWTSSKSARTGTTTTLSKSTASTSQTTATSTPSIPPENAGHSLTTVPLLALVASAALCLLVL